MESTEGRECVFVCSLVPHSHHQKQKITLNTGQVDGFLKKKKKCQSCRWETWKSSQASEIAVIIEKGFKIKAAGERFFWSHYVVQGHQTWLTSLTGYWNPVADLSMFQPLWSVHICAIAFLRSSLLHISPSFTVPWGVLYSGAVRIKPRRHLLLSVSTWANVNLIWDETEHGWGFYSARSLRRHQKKKVLSSLRNTCLVGLNIWKSFLSLRCFRIGLFLHVCVHVAVFVRSGLKFRKSRRCYVCWICWDTHRPHTRVGFWWFQPPCRADRSTWPSVTAPQCGSYYSICEQRLLHTCPPLIREKKCERNKSKSQGWSNKPVLLVQELC